MKIMKGLKYKVPILKKSSPPFMPFSNFMVKLPLLVFQSLRQPHHIIKLHRGKFIHIL